MFYWLICTSSASPLLNLVNQNGQIDYASHAQTIDHQTWVDSLTSVQVPSNPTEAKAFWINTYNSLTIHVVLKAYPIHSIRDIDNGKVWDTAKFQIGSETLTLNDIEHIKLRAFNDPRTHAALNCASIGCPALRPTPYSAQNLDIELDAASRAWVAHNAYSYDDGWFSNTLYLNAIFDWYASDFPTVSSDHINRRIPDKYLGAAQFIYKFGDSETQKQISNATTVSLQSYDWSLNTVQP